MQVQQQQYTYLNKMNEQIRQIVRETITELIDDSRCIHCGSITNEDLRKWFGKGLSLIHI